MLVLSRKKNETIEIEGGIRITVVEVRGNTVSFGIDAPAEVGILRGELIEGGMTPLAGGPLRDMASRRKRGD